MKFKVYTLQNFKQFPYLEKLSAKQLEEIEVIGHVLPFKTNNYVVEELIDWDNFEKSPMYILTFPQREMLKNSHYEFMLHNLKRTNDKTERRRIADEIRLDLNPHPAGQLNHNVPIFNGQKLTGIQHKYRETVLFFPTQGQTCHAYCTFCFRWPQFSGIDELKFAMKQGNLLIDYLNTKPNVTDILITGGDPMIMPFKYLDEYITGIIENAKYIKNIRIGTKSLSYWPYLYINQKDSDNILRLFERVNKSGKRLAFMAHFNHPVELSTDALKTAVARIRNTGTQIRSQSPILKHINNDGDIWAEMWKKQTELGIIPYYMFLARDTGAQDYFAVSLKNAWTIFKKAYAQVSGISRTVRGPSMSAHPGKIQVSGVSEINGEKVFVLNFIQARNPRWTNIPFFAKYDKNAIWLNDLRPAFGKEQFFFEEDAPIEYNDMEASSYDNRFSSPMLETNYL